MSVADWCGIFQTIAIIASAWFAFRMVKSHEKTSKQDSLVRLLISQNSDKALVEANRFVFRLVEKERDKGGLGKYITEESDEAHQKAKAAILLVLNTQEFIATGINLGVFDEEIYKRMQRTNVLKLWSTCCGFIESARKQQSNAALFVEFQKLADRWKEC